MPATATRKKPPKQRKQTKGDLLAEAADLLKRIEKAEDRCEESARRMVELKEDYKLAKESHANNVTELRKLARARKEKLPLFDQAVAPGPIPGTQGDPATNGQAATAVPKPPAEAAPSDSPAPTDWRELPIDMLAIQPKTANKLRAAAYGTLGRLADLMKDQESWWFKSVPGVGEESASKVSDALADFWKHHPEYTHAD
jgi:beta-glucosidase-like glycosyl hydrolase